MGSERRGVLSYVYAVVTRALEFRRVLFRSELDGLPRGERTEVERGGAGRHTELDVVRLLVVEAELGTFGGSHERARADLDLDSAGLTGVEDIARCQRRVDRRRRPILSPGPPEGNRPIDVAHAGRRRLGGLPGGLRAGWSRWCGRGRRLRIARADEARPTGRHGQHQKHCDDPPCTHGSLLSALGVPGDLPGGSLESCLQIRRSYRPDSLSSRRSTGTCIRLE